MKSHEKKLIVLLLFSALSGALGQPLALEANRVKFYSTKPKVNYRERLEALVRDFHNDVLKEQNIEKLNASVADKTKEIERMKILPNAKEAAIGEMEDTLELISYIRGILAQRKYARQLENIVQIVPYLTRPDQRKLESITNNFFKGTMYAMSLDQLTEKRNKALREIALLDLSPSITNPVVDFLRTRATEIYDRKNKIVRRQ